MENIDSYLLEQLKGINSRLDTIIKPRPQIEWLLYDWLDEWYRVYKVPKLKDSGLYQLKVCINKHIKQNIDNCYLADLTSIDIQKALNKIQSSRMRKYTYDTWNASLRQARKNKYILEDIMFGVDAVIHHRQKGMALSYEDEMYFLTCIKGNRLEALYRFYLCTGCRKSEALNLTWDDIDLEHKRLHIPGTKTENAERIIPLFDATNEILQGLNKECTPFPFSPNLVEKHFQRLKKRYGLNFRIHDLRHTFATRCLEKGISMKTIQIWLGHSKMDTTANIYTHLLPAFEQSEIEKYNKKITLSI